MKLASIGQALAIGFLGAGLCAAAAPGAAYIEGTVEAIPAKASGALQVVDSNTLEFHYGDSNYAIPAASILSYKWGRRVDGVRDQLALGVRALSHTVLPMFKPETKLLTIDFRPGEAEHTQRVVFAVPKSQIAQLSPVLDSWISKNQALPKADSEELWWGNRYWKTSRNRQYWEAQKAARTRPAERGETVASREDE